MEWVRCEDGLPHYGECCRVWRRKHFTATGKNVPNTIVSAMKVIIEYAEAEGKSIT